MVRTGTAIRHGFGRKLIALTMIAFFLTVAFGVVSLTGRANASSSCAPFSCTSFDVSNDNGNTTSPTVASSGQYVYVTWDQSLNTVWIRVNTDYGNPNSWENSTLLSNTLGGVGEVVMSVNNSYVYVAWSQIIGSNTDQIMFVSSSNYGQTFSAPLDVPASLGHANDPTITPVLASWGTTVYLAWDVDSGNNDGSWVTASANAGTTWSAAYQVSHNQHEPQLAATAQYGYFVGDGAAYAYTNDTGSVWHQAKSGANGFGSAGSEPWIAASGSNVYLTSEMKGSNGNGIIKVWYSHDSGSTFTETVVSGSIVNDWEPQLAAQGNDVFLAFRTLGDQNITPPETVSAYIVSSYNAGVNWTAPVLLSRAGHLTGWPLDVSVQGQYVYTMFGSMTSSNGTTMNAYASFSNSYGSNYSTVDISNNAVGVAAPPTDIESASISALANGTEAYAVWQQSNASYNLNSTSKYSGAATWQIYFNGPINNPVTTTSTSTSSTTSTTSSASPDTTTVDTTVTVVSTSTSPKSTTSPVTTVKTSSADTTGRSTDSTSSSQTVSSSSLLTSTSESTVPPSSAHGLSFTERLIAASTVAVIIVGSAYGVVRMRKRKA